MSDKEDFENDQKSIEEFQMIIRRYNAMKYLLACEAKKNGGTLMMESDCKENFTDVGFHLDVEDEVLRLTINMGEKKPETH